MKPVKIKSIFKKEIMDLLRDKKTLIMMVLVPLVLYPLIFMVAMLVASSVATGLNEAEYKVAIVMENENQNNNVDTSQKDMTYADLFALDEFVEFIENTEDDLGYHLKVSSQASIEDLSAEEVDGIILVDASKDKVNFTVQYLSSVTDSAKASDMVEDKLEQYKDYLQAKRLEQMGYDAEQMMNPAEVHWEDLSNNEERLGSILGSILPFLLITSILMGAVYPAIDTTAGEKERGTLETLLTLPVRNDELIMGKFLAVALVAVVSAVLNLLSMGIVAGFIFTMIGTTESDYTKFNMVEYIPALLIVVLCVIAFAMFISAITMCITTFAKSYKEANNYVTPLLLIVMFTGYIGFIPNIEFTPLLASVPVVNICLLITNILVFKYNFYLILIVLVTNVAYAVLAIWALGKIYNSEEVLFGEGGMSLQIFANRKELKKGGVPTFSDAVLVAAVSMLLLLYVGTIVQMKFLMAGLLMTQLMILLVPVLAAWYTKKDFKKTFSLQNPGWKGVLGAILLEIGVWILVMLGSVVLQKIFPQDTEQVNEAFELLMDGVGFLPAFLVIAVAPAICEESLFRGYIFSAARKKFKPWVAILIVSALFGVYHLSFVKFFTTGLLGIAFAYGVYCTGSIVCSAMMHLINNGISVVMMYYGEWLENIPWLSMENLTALNVAGMILVAVLCGVGGGMLLWKCKKRV